MPIEILSTHAKAGNEPFMGNSCMRLLCEYSMLLKGLELGEEDTADAEKEKSLHEVPFHTSSLIEQLAKALEKHSETSCIHCKRAFGVLLMKEQGGNADHFASDSSDDDDDKNEDDDDDAAVVVDDEDIVQSNVCCWLRSIRKPKGLELRKIEQSGINQ